jgi:predicted DNA-binding WGR domain protein
LNKSYTLNGNQITNIPVFNLGRGKGHRGRHPRFFLGANSVTNINETSNNTKSEEFQLTSLINLNAIDIYGRTCIHHLVQPFSEGTYRNNIEILQLLHFCGASLTIPDLSDLTPLQYSIENNYQHLSNELIKLTNNKKYSIKKTIIEKFNVNDPNKNLLDKPDFYNDAQHLIDEYILSHPISKTNTIYKVDPTSGMSLTGEILIDTDKNQPYDVRLTKTDVSYGTLGLYNFYRMQIIKHNNKKNLFFLFTRWGRIGSDEGQHQLTPYSTFNECVKEFLKIFREKTGNLWKDTDQFEIKPKKYTLVQLNEYEIKKHPNIPIDFDRLQAEHEQPSSKLQSSVYKNLMRTFITCQTIRRTELDVEWMPASQLKCETLEKARDLLGKIKDIIEKKEKFNSEKSSNQKDELKFFLESIRQYTNEYYTLIPLNNYSDEKLIIIQDNNILKQQEKILEDLFQLQLSYKILLGAQANLKYISSLDYIYKCLNCQFEVLNKDDIDSQFILRYIWASSPNIQVEQIFKIARANEDERLMKCNIGNRYLLWHGTSICNLISILTRGMLYLFSVNQFEFIPFRTSGWIFSCKCVWKFIWKGNENRHRS